MSLEKFDFLLLDKCPNDWDAISRECDGFVLSSFSAGKIYSDLSIGKIRYLRMYGDNKLLCQLMLSDVLVGWYILSKFLPGFILRFLLRFPFLTTIYFHLSFVEVDKLSLDSQKKYLLALIRYIISLAKSEKKNIGLGDLIFTQDESLVDEIIKEDWQGTLIKKTATVRINLIGTVEDYFKSLHVKRRSDINYAIKNGVVVKKFEGVKAVNEFFPVWKKTMNNFGLIIPNRDFVLRMFTKLRTKYFIAYHMGEVVCGSGVAYFGNTCLEVSMFSTPYEKENNTRGGDLIKWEIIKDCFLEGVKIYDLHMIDVSNHNKGINFFKEKWAENKIFGVTLFYRIGIINWLKKIINYVR